MDTKNLRWLARFRWRPSRSVGAVRTCAPSMTADRRQSVGGERRDAFPIASLSLLIPVLTVSTSIDAIPFKSGSRSRAPARKRKKKKRKKRQTNKKLWHHGLAFHAQTQLRRRQEDKDEIMNRCKSHLS